MGTQLFISAVTNEFRSCREQLSSDLRFPGVVAQNQEEYLEQLASGHSLLIKLDDYIRDCDAVIHLIGEQTSKDGKPASRDAVDDLLTRYPDFASTVNLDEGDLRRFSCTQWEAWLAYYHIKKSNHELKLVVSTPVDGFIPDRPADSETAAAQKRAQAWYSQELRKRCRYSEIEFADCKDLSIQVLRALREILPGQQPEQRIAPSRIASRHTSDEFLGRETEQAWLDDAWQGGANVFAIIAWGGVGKTALLASWVQSRFRVNNWKNGDGQPEPSFYFDWTFYDQGTRSDDDTQAGAASVDSFFERALTFFGDPNPHRPGKGGRLAGLIQQRRGLLVLDGLEPLQHPPNHPQAGQIIDPDLHELLATLAQRNAGLCIISSRQTVTDLTGHLAETAPQKSLDQLPEAVGVQLLQTLGVRGSDDELQEAVREYQGHALSLILLGRYLAAAKGGDIRRRDTIGLDRANQQRDARTRNAWNVLAAYEKWLASPEGRPADLQALRLTGLFDRPATPGCLDALRAEPRIEGISNLLAPLADDELNIVLQRLHDVQLIKLKFPEQTNDDAPQPEPHQVPLDAHPLIREYFAEQLRTRNPEAFHVAHSRLFDHLCDTAEYQPDTLEGLQPLYKAVVHGCLAGRHQQACGEVYRYRILRGTRDGGYYSSKVLGAMGANLAAVSGFFEKSWTKVSGNLSNTNQDWMISEAAFYLRALGRIAEAQEPLCISMERRIQEGDWENSAVLAHNLVEFEVILGRLKSARQKAQNAIHLADRSDTHHEKMNTRAIAADAFFQSGETHKAKKLFESAERLQVEHNPKQGQLYSIWGFHYCNFLMAPVERLALQRMSLCHLQSRERALRQQAKESADSVGGMTTDVMRGLLSEIERRAMTSLDWPSLRQNLLSSALDRLTLARVAVFRAALSANAPSVLKTSILDVALNQVREAGEETFIPIALITAAHGYALLGDHGVAQSHLTDAQLIAERGPMPLHLADVHLHRARLFRDRDELAKAKELIERHGYWRRREELSDAEVASGWW